VTADTSSHPLRSVFELGARLGCKWRSIDKAAKTTSRTIEKLREALDAAFDSEDYSIVVFGSLARYEFTPHSDLDWTLLVDGIAADDHWDVACRVREAVHPIVKKEPGREGTFGSLAFGHELLHRIGGPDDTNQNTTRRILLLLESLPFGRRDAYDRVIRGVLRRYLSEDEAFRNWRAAQPVPRFLLNDFARFWWTMAVDFAYKRRSRQGSGAVLRNLKLRMSRKLIYAAGMLTCFSLALDKAAAEKLRSGEPSSSGNAGVEKRVEHFKRLLEKPPLEILAAHLIDHQHLNDAAKKIFNAYDRFLGALANVKHRGHLEELNENVRQDDALYREVRQATHEFREGLIEVFFDEKSGLADLTKSYGVF
jgi:predicted nucleotidyltransferase